MQNKLFIIQTYAQNPHNTQPHTLIEILPYPEIKINNAIT